MKKLYFTLPFLIALLLTIKVSSQNITLSGYVKDAQTQESLIGATVFESNRQTGVVTNDYGYFSLTLPKVDTIGLVISYIGYQAQAKKIATKEDLRLDLLLEPNSNTLSEVTVSASRNNDNVQRAQMSVIDVPMRAINSLPRLTARCKAAN